MVTNGNGFPKHPTPRTEDRYLIPAGESKDTCRIPTSPDEPTTVTRRDILPALLFRRILSRYAPNELIPASLTSRRFNWRSACARNGAIKFRWIRETPGEFVSLPFPSPKPMRSPLEGIERYTGRNEASCASFCTAFTRVINFGTPLQSARS